MASPASKPRQTKKGAPAPQDGSVPPSRGAKKDAGPEEELPDSQAIAHSLALVRAFMADPRQERVRFFLRRLAATAPPQVLLLEGGTAQERLDAAHYWTLLLNCEGRRDQRAFACPEPSPRRGLLDAGGVAPSAGLGPDGASTGGLGASDPACVVNPPEPCLECSLCVRMVTHLHRDCWFLDGHAASIKIDQVREMRSVLGEPPREARFRVVILREAQALVDAAANALLKSLEEPAHNTTFLLLAPQRERLLPTLVSRSLTLTLAWPDALGVSQSGLGEQLSSGDERDMAVWEAGLCRFLQNGQGWFELTGARGAVDTHLANEILGLCRRALAGRLRARQSNAPPREGLESLLAGIPPRRMRMLDEALAECQDSLGFGVNPTLVLEWLATRLFFLVPR